MSTSQDKYVVPGLARGLQVLRSFTPQAAQLRLTDIADHLGISRSAAFRVVYTLNHLGYLQHEAATGFYSLGPAVLTLSQGYVPVREVAELARPILQVLRDDSKWSAHLGVLDGLHILYLLSIPAERRSKGLVQTGSRLPAHNTAMGRVCLADLDDRELRARYKNRDRHSGPVKPILKDIVVRARQDRGAVFVQHIGDFEAGIASVATPIRDHTGRVIAALSLTAEIAALDGAEIDTGIKQQLINAAGKISLLLGFQRE